MFATLGQCYKTFYHGYLLSFYGITAILMFYNTEWQYDHGMAVNYNGKKFYNNDPWCHEVRVNFGILTTVYIIQSILFHSANMLWQHLKVLRAYRRGIIIVGQYLWWRINTCVTMDKLKLTGRNLWPVL
jgi:hypothetical protein